MNFDIFSRSNYLVSVITISGMFGSVQIFTEVFFTSASHTGKFEINLSETVVTFLTRSRST